MKFLLLILVFHTLTYGQEEWQPKILAANKVLVAASYWEVPISNDPSGLMFFEEVHFNEAGLPVKSFCDNCLMSSHGPSYDVVTKYSYVGGQLVRSYKTAMDTTNVEYLYYDDRRIVLELKTDGKENRVGVGIVTKDELGRETKNVEVDFRHTTAGNHWLHLRYKVSVHKQNSKEERERMMVFDVKPEQMTILAASKNLTELEQVIAHIEKNDFLKLMSDVKFNKRQIYKYENGLLKEVKFPKRRGYVKYSYDEKGLLSESFTHFGVFDNVTKYKYIFRN